MAKLLKLRYCPVCGSAISRNFGQGAIYWNITWKCRKIGCSMSEHWRPLHGWNEYYPPNAHALLIETLKEIVWKKEIERLAADMENLAEIWPVWGFRCSGKPYITNQDQIDRELARRERARLKPS